MAATPVRVFLSYARLDRPRIQPLIAALKDSKIEVWWDARIDGGALFAKTIAAALEASDAVIVVWSKVSIDSNWVLDLVQRFPRPQGHRAVHRNAIGRLVPARRQRTPRRGRGARQRVADRGGDRLQPLVAGVQPHLAGHLRGAIGDRRQRGHHARRADRDAQPNRGGTTNVIAFEPRAAVCAPRSLLDPLRSTTRIRQPPRTSRRKGPRLPRWGAARTWGTLDGIDTLNGWRVALSGEPTTTI